MDKVPYQMLDVDEKEAEYLLIAENVERRGQAETDPIKKSRIANFLKEYWGVNHGGSRGQNELLKTNKDIGNFINSDERTTKMMVKRNDIIPEVQNIVSEVKLSQTVSKQLADLKIKNQREIIK